MSLQPHFRHPSVQRSMCLPISLGKLRKLGGDRISMAHRFYLSQLTNVSDMCVWQCCAQGSRPFLRGAAPTARLCQNRLHLLVASGGVSHHMFVFRERLVGRLGSCRQSLRCRGTRLRYAIRFRYRLTPKSGGGDVHNEVCGGVVVKVFMHMGANPLAWALRGMVVGMRKAHAEPHSGELLQMPTQLAVPCLG